MESIKSVIGQYLTCIFMTAAKFKSEKSINCQFEQKVIVHLVTMSELVCQHNNCSCLRQFIFHFQSSSLFSSSSLTWFSGLSQHVTWQDPHADVQGSIFFLQLQRGVPQAVLQLQCIILRRFFGAAFMPVMIVTNWVSSSAHPQSRGSMSLSIPIQTMTW